MNENKLPERYAEAGIEDTTGHITTDNLGVTMSIAVSSMGIASMAMALNLKVDDLYSFAQYALAVLQQTQLVNYAAIGSLLLGLAIVVCGALWGAAALKYKKNVSRFVLVVVIGVSAAQLALGALIQQGVGTIEDAIYSTQPSTGGDGFIERVKHFQYSMFNTCCAANGWSSEVYGANSSTLDYKDDCSRVKNSTVSCSDVCVDDGLKAWNLPNTGGLVIPPEDKDLDGYVKRCDLLAFPNVCGLCCHAGTAPRTCIFNPELYREYDATVQANKGPLCAQMKRAIIDITGVKVPGVISIEIAGFTNGYTKLPIVGPPVDPTYGCGKGFAKAFEAAQFLWAKQKLTPLATCLLAVGVLQILVAFLGLASSASTTGRAKETPEQAYDRYMREITADSNNNSNRPSAKVEFEMANPNRNSVQSAYSRGGVGGPVTAAAYMNQGRVGDSAGSALAANFNVDDKI